MDWTTNLIVQIVAGFAGAHFAATALHEHRFNRALPEVFFRLLHVSQQYAKIQHEFIEAGCFPWNYGGHIRTVEINRSCRACSTDLRRRRKY
jgi:hypothetical protein